PFRLRRQTIPRPLQVIGSQLHARSVVAVRVELVAPLVIRYPLLLTQPVAIRRRIVPRHVVHRTVVRGGMLPRYGLVLAEAEKLFDRDFLGGDGERAADSPPVAQLLVPPGTSGAAFLRRGRTHPELHRTGNDHQRLPLAIDVPASIVLASL